MHWELTGGSKSANDSQNVEAFGVMAFGQGTVTDQSCPGDLRVEVIFRLIGVILCQGVDLFLDVFFGNFNQKIREESIAGTDDIEPEDGDPAKSPQGFTGHSAVILMDVRFGMDEYDLRVKVMIDLDHVFENFLARLWEAPCLELSHGDVLFG